MSANKFTDEFKRDAVAKVEDRGYPVREVAERLGVSTNSIYTWQKQFSRPARVIQEFDAQADEIRRLKRDLASNSICQDAMAVHFRRLLHSALAMVTSFLATAVMMTLWGLPAFRRRSAKGFRLGL